MQSHEYLHTEELGSPACQLLLNRDAGLVAVASDDVAPVPGSNAEMAPGRLVLPGTGTGGVGR